MIEYLSFGRCDIFLPKETRHVHCRRYPRGSYEIGDLVGAGGTAEAYWAQDTRLDRNLAVKVLASHLSDDTGLRQRFEREARTISGLNRPHICTLFDVGREEASGRLVQVVETCWKDS